jgi:hypothetical protein
VYIFCVACVFMLVDVDVCVCVCVCDGYVGNFVAVVMARDVSRLASFESGHGRLVRPKGFDIENETFKTLGRRSITISASGDSSV